MDWLPNQLLEFRNRHFFMADVATFLITPTIALLICQDGNLNLSTFPLHLVVLTGIFLLTKLTLLYRASLYRQYWRYASLDELLSTVQTMLMVILLQTLLFATFYLSSTFSIQQLPRPLPLLDGILSLLVVCGLRFGIAAMERAKQQRKRMHRYERVLIVGAGAAGVSLAEKMQTSPWLKFEPVGFIDDAPEKLNLRIRRILVVGTRYEIPEMVRSLDIQRVIIAMPTAPGRVIREILELCQTTGVKTSTLPGIHDVLSNHTHISQMREIRIEDLLRREPVHTEIDQVLKLISGKCVLVTGAGGSIGSELCRQVLKCAPREIILVGHGENSIFKIQQELQLYLQEKLKSTQTPHAPPQLIALIADIRHQSRLEYIFATYKPEIVFHAAAHKHVPMMEFNESEAVSNNIVGTRNLVNLSQKHQVQTFVMLSTDKAVNPTSIMGSSKRVAELLVLQAAQRSQRSFMVVRFGNVLGSRGSVVPTFQQQIAAGGPITVTHPEVCRYFMTIPEAVQLVLQAAATARRGGVFMLNMGQPVKIVDLAKAMIKLSGYKVHQDIDIVYTGLRPGEKLFEELLVPGEQYDSTQHDKILMVKNAMSFIPQELDQAIFRLEKAAEKHDHEYIRTQLKALSQEPDPNQLSNRRTDAGSLVTSWEQGV